MRQRAICVVVGAAATATLLTAGPAGANSAASSVPTSSTNRSALAGSGNLAAAYRSVVAVPRAPRYRVTNRQVIVVTATSWRSTSGWLRTYDRTPGGWRLRLQVKAFLGYGGLVMASRRRQSTGTTPAGSFAITSTFGRLSDPGTAMPYVRVGRDHWWVQDRRSRYYNDMRLGRLGGFQRKTRGYNASERLYDKGRQYDYVAVIDFNRPRPVVGRGSGIFLHISKGKPTVGCISMSRASMRAVLRWLRPDRQPRIVIGPTTWLSN